LADNVDRNLSERQVEFATTIHGAGTDLLNLINDILDLSKIESGTVSVQCEEVSFTELSDAVQRNFRHETATGGLAFAIELDAHLPESLFTDSKRLLQVLKNLLANAFKCTDEGGVSLDVRPVTSGWTPGQHVLDGAPAVIAFAVSDTGVGIPLDKQRIIFEAFQQADAGTARKHGGTGLGLAISRELAQLLGGEIKLRSAPGSGSTFTLYLPLRYAGAAAPLDLGERGERRKRALAVDSSKNGVRAVTVSDDRAALAQGEGFVLIVESDVRCARELLDLVRRRGAKGVVTPR